MIVDGSIWIKDTFLVIHFYFGPMTLTMRRNVGPPGDEALRRPVGQLAPPSPCTPSPSEAGRLLGRRVCSYFCSPQGGGYRAAGGRRGGEGEFPSVRQENSMRKPSYPYSLKGKCLFQTSLRRAVPFPPCTARGMMKQLSPVGSDSLVYHHSPPFSLTTSLKIHPPQKCLSTVDYFKN